MRESLKYLQNQVEWIDTDNLYQAVSEIKQVLLKIIEDLDRALPLEVEQD